MDQQWLDMHATYMDFNVCCLSIQVLATRKLSPSNLFLTSSSMVAKNYQLRIVLLKLQTVMKATRRQIERELLLEDILRIEDMPSYKLLAR